VRLTDIHLGYVIITVALLTDSNTTNSLLPHSKFLQIDPCTHCVCMLHYLAPISKAKGMLIVLVTPEDFLELVIPQKTCPKLHG